MKRTPATHGGPAFAALLVCFANGAVIARAGELPSTRDLPAASSPSATQLDPSCFTTALVPTPGVAVMRLPRGFIRTGSDSVWSRAGAWTPGRDYRLDPLRGDLRLLRMLAPGDTVWVRACGLVSPPALEYQRQVYRPARSPGTSDTASAQPELAASVRPATARDPRVAPAGAALAVNGNKTIAVDFGSAQDAALRQSLDLSVSGHVAPGVELTGVLSDRDTPLSAAGATQDLQSIDRGASSTSRRRPSSSC